MNLSETLNAPYNTLNISKSNQENNYNDPTIKLVENYLKNNNSMYNNEGKYYDQYLFNKKFDSYIEDKNKERIKKEKVQIYDLDRVDNIQIAPYQLPIDKLLINLKNVWFNFFDSILYLSNPLDNFKNDNLFYFGISFIAIYIIFIVLNYLFE